MTREEFLTCLKRAKNVYGMVMLWANDGMYIKLTKRDVINQLGDSTYVLSAEMRDGDLYIG